MKKLLFLFAILSSVFLFQFCTKTNNEPTLINTTDGPNLPTIPYVYAISYPTHIQIALSTTDNTPRNNQITDAGATLGRVLFYDKHLSKNNTVSCASCHKQEDSFDDNKALSTGFNGANTARNSMALLNVRFYQSGKMFWDERATSVEEQALQPIQNPIEMGLTLDELESKVQGLSYYHDLFLKAFGSSEIDSVKISKAIAQFVRSMVTYQAKYDLVKEGKESFSTAEARGEQLFLNAGGPGVGTCASCHTPPMFLTSNPAKGFALADDQDLGINGTNRFKSGSLRNIMIRTHLFHNGSITTVQAMLSGNNGRPIPQHSIASQDTADMLAFLNTLTDETILTESKFSDPFKN